MNIVANNTLLRYFKKISIFKVDLGTNLKGAVQAKKDPDFTIKIRDEFVKRYQTITNKIIFKYGEIGKLGFYEDNTIPTNEFHIYDTDKIFEITVKNDDLLKESSVYLTEVLKSIENGEMEEMEEKEDDMVKHITYTNMPDDLQRPDLKLPKDQYIEAMVNRRKTMSRMNGNR